MLLLLFQLDASNYIVIVLKTVGVCLTDGFGSGHVGCNEDLEGLEVGVLNRVKDSMLLASLSMN